MWASKRSQILALRARLNRRQLHWGIASRALWTLVLCLEHSLLRQFGRPSSPASQPAVSDLQGSDAMTLV